MRTVFILLTVHSYWSGLKGTKRQAKCVVWINYCKIALTQETSESVHSNIRGKKSLKRGEGKKGGKEGMQKTACQEWPRKLSCLGFLLVGSSRFASKGALDWINTYTLGTLNGERARKSCRPRFTNEPWNYCLSACRVKEQPEIFKSSLQNAQDALSFLLAI